MAGEQKGREVVFRADVGNEQVVLAAALCSGERAAAFRAAAVRHPPDAFLAREHPEIWRALREAHNRGLPPDPATLNRLSGGNVDLDYLAELMAARPDLPDDATLGFALEQLAWDRQKHVAVTGPVDALLDAIQKGEGPERVRGLARAVSASFDGWGDRKHLLDPDALVREQVADLRERMVGRAVYPYGIPGLDLFDPEKGKEARRRMIPGAKPGTVTVVTGVPGSGKALALDTPIATCRGWTTMGEIVPGEVVFDENGERCKVTWASDVMVGRECFEVVFDDGERIVADADHLWKTTTKSERRALTMRSEEWRTARRVARGAKTRRVRVSESLLSRRPELDPDGSVRTTRQLAKTLTARGTHTNHAVKRAAPLVLADAVLPIDPYVLGAWLGDGTSACGHITCADEEIIDRVRAAGFVVTRSKSAILRWQVSGLHRQLRELGVRNNKRIPIEYLRGSIAQRRDLLRGLMDTDGHCTKIGACEFTTTSRYIASGFSELLSSLGIRASARTGVARLNGRIISSKWRFTFTPNFDAFYLPRKSRLLKLATRSTTTRRYVVDVRCVESVPVRCIAVDSPSRLFLAGRSMVPTHNSTTTARIVLGLARQKRRTLYGAWEMQGGVTLELLAILSLGWSRSAMTEGRFRNEELRQIETRMHEISKWVRFLANPFRRGGGGRPSNERNLDAVHGYLADSGCEIFVADLWKRCLVEARPEDEEEALYRQQAMAEELGVHAILVQQQRLKDIELRPDKRPTREGIKGSGAWTEIADTILGVHRPALWKPVTDDVIEVDVLKQRFGRWPLAVEFDWDPDRGKIEGGRSVDYEMSSAGSEGNAIDRMMRSSEKPKGQPRGKR